MHMYTLINDIMGIRFALEQNVINTEDANPDIQRQSLVSRSVEEDSLCDFSPTSSTLFLYVLSQTQWRSHKTPYSMFSQTP